ncbi:RNA ligase/cyclic nucleotide phosphodiesterase [Penicillium sp. IBT 16267x]|nr:RNA ligase/cyclic nucleotide phosphodiesterase [Penicillium sp. IBT 16267x]
MSSLVISEDNPFQVLITETNHDLTALQLRYQGHRVTRNEQQGTKILADSFPGWSLDPILSQLDGPGKEDGYLDPRNCLVIWARPPPHIRDLTCFIQSELKEVSPSIWLMPPQNLHTTVLEVAHSLTEKEIENLVQNLQASKDMTAAQIAEYPVTHKSRLLKPMVSFDASAMALSFVPAAGENLPAGDNGDDYSYHHLRRDVFQMVRQAQLPVASRYIVPSAHVTIARFINNEDFIVQGAEGAELDRARVKMLVEKVEAINKKLEAEFWPQADGTVPEGGEWIVGQQNLVIRRGRLWYGGGENVSMGSKN